MVTKSPALFDFMIERRYFPKGRYDHPPAGLLQLRSVRSGSSYAGIDLGAGLHQVFTRPGDLLLTLPTSATAFHIEEGRELTFLELPAADAAHLVSDFGGEVGNLARLAVRPFRDVLIAELLRRLDDQESGDQPLKAAMVRVVIGSLVRRARLIGDRVDYPALTPRRFQAVIDAIDARLNASWSVEELAAIAGMRTRAFSAAFREASGLPAYQFVVKRRANLAVDLLSNTTLPLAEVAQRAGFSHQAHMTRVLKRLVRRTPGQIRGDAATGGKPL